MTTSHPKIVLFHHDKTRLWMKLFVSNYTLVPCIVFNKIRWDQCELILWTLEDIPSPPPTNCNLRVRGLIFVFLNLHLNTQNTNTIFVNIGWHDNPPTSTGLQPWVERSYRIKFHYLINFMTGSTSTFVIVFQLWTISINKSPIFHIAMLTPQPPSIPFIHLQHHGARSIWDGIFLATQDAI